MVGLPGAGKTTFADKFADTFQTPYVSSDKLRAQLSVLETNGTTIRALDTVLMGQLSELLKTGQTVIYDAETASRARRQLVSRLARTAGYTPLLIWVQTDINSAKARVAKVKKASKTSYDDASFTQASERFSPPHAAERPLVISGKHTFATQVKIVLKHLVEPRTQEVTSQKAAIPERPKRQNGRSILIR